MKKAFDFFYNKHRNAVLCVVFVAYSLAEMVQLSTLSLVNWGNIFSRVVQSLCGIVLGIYLFIDFINGKFKITFFLFAGLVCAVGPLFSHHKLLCFFMAFSYVYKDCDFKQILKIFSITILSGVIAVFSLALTGCIDNFIQSRGDIARFSLGFDWAGPPMTYYLFFCLAYNYIRKEKITYLELIVEVALSYVMYHITDTRAGFVLTCAIIAISLILKIFNLSHVKKWFQNRKIYQKVYNYFACDKINQIWARFFAVIPVLFIGIFGILVALYPLGSRFIIKIDHLLSGRLALTYNAFLNRDITIFGGIFDWIENGNYVGVDSAFYHCLFNLGILPTLFLLFVTMLIFYKAFREKKYLLCVILILVMCSALIDTFYLDVGCNVFLLSLIDGSIGRKMMFGIEKTQVAALKKSEDAKEAMVGQRVTAVVVTYNRKELLKECLSALVKQNYQTLQVLIVDNASTDGTHDYIVDLIDNKKIIYLNTGENLGGAGGFNFGMKEAMRMGCDYIWLMDDDCVVHEDSLVELIKYAQTINNDFGFLSSVVRWKDDSICNMNVQRTSIAQEVKDFTQNQKIELASFVSLLVKANVVEDVGLPIKDFFIWGDDWEYTSRIAKQYDCYLVANSVVTHKSVSNMGCNIVKDASNRIDRYFYCYRNESYLYNNLGFEGKLYFFLKKNYHKVKLFLSHSKDKKVKFDIIKKGCQASKKFNPKIEYGYKPDTKVEVCECFAEPLLYGGQEAFMLNMYKNFNHDQLRYTFFTPFENGNKELQLLANNRNEKIISYNYKFDSKLRKLNIFNAYQKFFKENKFDVVHIQTGSVWALLHIAKIAKRNGIKRVIAHSHCAGNYNLKYKISKIISDKQIEKYVDEYFACSELAGKWKFPKEIMDSGKCTIIKNGVDLKKFNFNQEERQAYRKTFGLSNELVLCNVGRFEYQKNHEFIVEIAKILHEKQFDYKFILVGTGSLKETIVKEIDDLQLTDKFIFLENRTDIAQIMMASDVFVMPSRYEGLPVTLVEAQATGLRSIVSDTVTQEIGITGIVQFLPITDAGVWAEYIIKNCNKIKNREEYAHMVTKAGYSAETSAKKIESIYLGM